MNINFGSLLFNNGQNNVNSNIGTSNTEDVPIQSTDVAVDLKNLKPGQMFEGDIQDIDNLNVKILLDNKLILSAVMNDSVNLNVGDHIVFQVKENSDVRTVIRPVQLNETNNNLIMKAIDLAGIENSSKNISLVNELVTQGMPVDKKTISDMIRLSNQFPNEDITKIVVLNKNHIPLSSDNLKMYDTYMNNQGNITNNLNNIAEKIPAVIEQSLSYSNDDSIYRDIISGIFNDDANAFTAPADSSNGEPAQHINTNTSSGELVQHINSYNEENVNVTSQENVIKSADIQNTELKDNIAPVQNIPEENVTEYEKVIDNIKDIINELTVDSHNNPSPGNTDGNIVQKDNYENVVDNSSAKLQTTDISNTSSTLNSSAVIDDLTQKIQNQNVINVETNQNIHTKPEVSDNTTDTGKSLSKDIPEQDINKHIEYSDTSYELKNRVYNVLSNIADPQVKKMVVQSKPFAELMKAVLVKQFVPDVHTYARTQNPKKLVEDVYKRIEEELEKTDNLLKEAVANGKLPLKSASVLTNQLRMAGQNLNFMNDLNNAASYIQIPVKMNKEEKAGELYVLNRNKNKTISDGISAFLHFNLEHLGATDIRIMLKDSNLQMKFEINDIESVKLVDKHLEELSDALKRKGFYVNSSVSYKDDFEDNSLQNILGHDESHTSGKMYTLDIRT